MKDETTAKHCVACGQVKLPDDYWQRKITYWQDLAVANRKVAENAQAQRDKAMEEAANELAAQKEQLRLCNVDQFSTEAELAAAQKKNNLLACALRALLSKCPDCGGTGKVGTGIIQIGRPAQMPCFVCAGERQILLREMGARQSSHQPLA